MQRGPEGAYVFLVDARQRAEARPVRLLQVQQDAAVIDRGVSEGDRVVVAGQYRLDRGTKVECLDKSRVPAPGRPEPLCDRLTMNFAAHFIGRPIATSLLMFALIVAGLLALRELPTAALPSVESPIIRVSTSASGRCARDHGLLR